MTTARIRAAIVAVVTTIAMSTLVTSSEAKQPTPNNCRVVSEAGWVEWGHKHTRFGVLKRFRLITAETVRCGSAYATTIDVGSWHYPRQLIRP